MKSKASFNSDLLILALVIVIRWIIADALGVLELFDLSERGADTFAHLVFESLNQVLHCLGVVHGLNRTRQTLPHHILIFEMTDKGVDAGGVDLELSWVEIVVVEVGNQHLLGLLQELLIESVEHPNRLLSVAIFA